MSRKKIRECEGFTWLLCGRSKSSMISFLYGEEAALRSAAFDLYMNARHDPFTQGLPEIPTYIFCRRGCMAYKYAGARR